MRSRVVKSLPSIWTIVLCAAVAYGSGAFGAPLAPQSSQVGGVTIRVDPADVSAAASTWQFHVTLDTHGGSLDDDLAKTAVIVGAGGKQYAAAGWQGDRAGGHHRKGVLQFEPLLPLPDAIELRITRAGEPVPRRFRWKLK